MNNDENETRFQDIYEKAHKMIEDVEKCAFLKDIPYSKHWNERWIPKEDDTLREYISMYGTKWKLISSIWPSNMKNRKASELRHRWSRIRKGIEGKQICHYCGHLLRGHSCPILSFKPHVRNLICKQLKK